MEGEIRLEELCKKFDDFVAVDGIDIDMPPGEFFTLLGPSGCGKTTTLRMIAGFERPTSGRILLDGNDVARVPPHQRNVNTVFQSYALFPHLDVAKNVAFGLKYHKLSKEERAKRVGEALELVSMTELRAAQGGPAVRRAAAARRARARPRAAAARAAARRAAGRAGRAAAQEPPGRAQDAPGRARDHVHLRHARPERGAHDERPDRGDEQGPRRAGGARRRRSTRSPRRSSSPTSWVSRTCSARRRSGRMARPAPSRSATARCARSRARPTRAAT